MTTRKVDAPQDAHPQQETDTRNPNSSENIVAEQLRRRRDAASRLPPLADGRRDPIDAPPEKRQRRGPALFITIDDARGLALVRGPDADFATLAVAADARQRSRLGWVIPVSLVGDLMAYEKWNHSVVSVSHRNRRQRPAAGGGAA